MKPEFDMKIMIQSAVIGAEEELKNAGGKKNVRQPRILPVSKVGGVLLFIPILAGLSNFGD